MILSVLLTVLALQDPPRPIPPEVPPYEVPVPPYTPPASVPPGQKPPEPPVPIKPTDPIHKPDTPPGQSADFPPTRPRPPRSVDAPLGEDPVPPPGFEGATSPARRVLPSKQTTQTSPQSSSSVLPVTTPTLSDVLRLKFENHALRLRLVQVEQQLQQLVLSQERTALDQELATSHPGWRMDWQTGQLVPATATTTSPK